MCIRFESPFSYAFNSVFNYHLLSQHQLRGVYTRRHTHLKPKIAGGSVNPNYPPPPQHKECSIRTKLPVTSFFIKQHEPIEQCYILSGGYLGKISFKIMINKSYIELLNQYLKKSYVRYTSNRKETLHLTSHGKLKATHRQTWVTSVGAGIVLCGQYRHVVTFVVVTIVSNLVVAISDKIRGTGSSGRSRGIRLVDMWHPRRLFQKCRYKVFFRDLTIRFHCTA